MGEVIKGENDAKLFLVSYFPGHVPQRVGKGADFARVHGRLLH